MSVTHVQNIEYSQCYIKTAQGFTLTLAAEAKVAALLELRGSKLSSALVAELNTDMSTDLAAILTNAVAAVLSVTGDSPLATGGGAINGVGEATGGGATNGVGEATASTNGVGEATASTNGVGEEAESKSKLSLIRESNG